MKVIRQTNDKGNDEVIITLTPEDAELLQSVTLQFAEKVANCKPHKVKMRRLAMQIDKVIK